MWPSFHQLGREWRDVVKCRSSLLMCGQERLHMFYEWAWMG